LGDFPEACGEPLGCIRLFDCVVCVVKNIARSALNLKGNKDVFECAYRRVKHFLQTNAVEKCRNCTEWLKSNSIKSYEDIPVFLFSSFSKSACLFMFSFCKLFTAQSLERFPGQLIQTSSDLIYAVLLYFWQCYGLYKNSKMTCLCHSDVLCVHKKSWYFLKIHELANFMHFFHSARTYVNR
jgi:hypothetical protein